MLVTAKYHKRGFSNPHPSRVLHKSICSTHSTPRKERMRLSTYDIFPLCQIAKILEKPFGKRFDEFMGKNNIPNDNQYELTIDKTTTIAVLDLVEYATSYLDKKIH